VDAQGFHLLPGGVAAEDGGDDEGALAAGIGELDFPPVQLAPELGGDAFKVSPSCTSAMGTWVSTPSRCTQTLSVCGVSRRCSSSLERCSEVASTYSPQSSRAPMALAVKKSPRTSERS
jgi:hypothetical protein